MRRIKLYTATSLDGFLARLDGGIDWLATEGDYGYARFYDSIEWYRTKTLANAWALIEMGGKAFFEIKHGYHWFKQQAWVTLDFPVNDPELPLPLCMTMYLVYCINQDAAGAIAAISATSAVG